MSEQDWLTSTDPAAMLKEFNLSPTSQLMSKFASPNDRKLRLFACACCRQVWHLLTDERSRRAVEVAERFADGVDLVSLVEGQREGYAAHHRVKPATFLPWAACATDIFRQCFGPNWFACCKDAKLSTGTQAVLLRDIIGNPWKPVTLPLAVRPGDKLKLLTDPYRLVPVTSRKEAWAATVLEVAGKEMWVAPVGAPSERARWPLPHCPWLTPTVVSLATAAYDERPGKACDNCKGLGEIRSGHPLSWKDCPVCNERGCIEDGTLDNNRLAVLADALEDAGCDNEMILTHLRSEGPHVRGCWVLDLLLGKE